MFNGKIHVTVRAATDLPARLPAKSQAFRVSLDHEDVFETSAIGIRLSF